MQQRAVALLREVRACQRASGLDEGRGPEAVVAFPRRVVAHSPSFILRTFTTKFAAQSSIVSNLGGLRDVHRVPIVRTGERALRAHPVGHPALVNALRRVAFEQLDAPVKCLGSMEVPAIPLNERLEKAVLPNAEAVVAACAQILAY